MLVTCDGHDYNVVRSFFDYSVYDIFDSTEARVATMQKDGTSNEYWILDFKIPVFEYAVCRTHENNLLTDNERIHWAVNSYTAYVM